MLKYLFWFLGDVIYFCYHGNTKTYKQRDKFGYACLGKQSEKVNLA